MVGDKHEDKCFDDADTHAREPEHEERVGGGDEDADKQRNMEEQIQADGCSKHFSQVAGDDGQFAEDP